MLLSTFFAIAGLVSLSAASYLLQDDYNPTTFFDMFDFFTGADPTNGFVTYVDQTTAQSGGLISMENGTAVIGVDSTNVASSTGRSSVRLVSQNTYTHALVILDAAHMPGGVCGTWPALTVGPNWPDDGEIDIIEGVNSQTNNDMTLHTSAGCTITNADIMFAGTIETTDCNVDSTTQAANAGCGITSTSSTTFGDGFNNLGGGYYAMEWTSDAISIWFFPRGSEPSDIGSGSPDPTSWGTPSSVFQGDCDIDSRFQNHQIVFDTTFCGDWAGDVWTTDAVCGAKAATCQDFVQNNPDAFTDAFWTVNSLRVFQDDGSSASSSPSIVTASSTVTVSSQTASSKSVTVSPTTTAAANTTRSVSQASSPTSNTITSTTGATQSVLATTSIPTSLVTTFRHGGHTNSRRAEPLPVSNMSVMPMEYSPNARESPMAGIDDLRRDVGGLRHERHLAHHRHGHRHAAAIL